VSVYGGYFNGGLGIVLLALFSMWGMSNIHQINGLKNWLSFALSAISGLTLIAAAFVGAQLWTIAIILMITLGLRIKLRETQ
jgi:hypothetical protein